MNYFLLAFVMWTASALAEPTCSSVWIFKAWKTCAVAANGLNTSATPIPAGNLNISSDWVRGGSNQERICQSLEAKFNQQNLSVGKLAALTQLHPVSEEKRENMRIYVEYKYTCQVSIAQYPFNNKAAQACGEEEKLSYQVGGNPDAIAGTASCLSCDNLSSPEGKVRCLKASISNVIEPKAIDLRDTDLKAVSTQIKELLTIGNHLKINGLNNDLKTLSLFTNFIEKNPPQ